MNLKRKFINYICEQSKKTKNYNKRYLVNNLLPNKKLKLEPYIAYIFDIY